jgi:hypothetical protein
MTNCQSGHSTARRSRCCWLGSNSRRIPLRQTGSHRSRRTHSLKRRLRSTHPGRSGCPQDSTGRRGSNCRADRNRRMDRHMGQDSTRRMVNCRRRGSQNKLLSRQNLPARGSTESANSASRPARTNSKRCLDSCFRNLCNSATRMSLPVRTSLRRDRCSALSVEAAARVVE